MKAVTSRESSESEVFDPGPPPAVVLEVRLSEAQVDQFHRDGFTSVDRITTDEDSFTIREPTWGQRLV